MPTANSVTYSTHVDAAKARWKRRRNVQVGDRWLWGRPDSCNVS